MAFFGQRSAFGLDISDFSIKILNLKKRKKILEIDSFGILEIPSGIVEKGEVKNIQKLAELIKKAKNEVQGRKIKTKYVALCLPEQKAFLQVIQLPKMEKEAVKKAVFFEAENYIPLPLKDVYLDCEIVPPLKDNLDHLDVLIVALPKKIVDPYVEAVKRAGFLPKIIEVESLSIARALVKDFVSLNPLLIVDIGATKTTLIVFSQRAVKFSSCLPISAKLFTKMISKNLRIDLKEAEALKIKYGLLEPLKVKLKAQKKDGVKFQKISLLKNQIFEALIPVLSDLKDQIKNCIDYYLSHAQHEHSVSGSLEIKKILLSGGGSLLKGLREFLEKTLQKKVQLANPFINVFPSNFPENFSPQNFIRYSAALGLALRAIKEDDQSFTS